MRWQEKARGAAGSSRMHGCAEIMLAPSGRARTAGGIPAWGHGGDEELVS